MEYRYGMRERGCSVGNQPNDFVRCEDDPSGIYKNILTYERELSPEELDKFHFVLLDTITELL